MNCPWKLKCPIGWLIYSDYIGGKNMLKQTQVISNPGPLDYKTSALSTRPRSLDYSPMKNNEWNTRAPDITKLWLAKSLKFGPNTNPHTHTPPHTPPHPPVNAEQITAPKAHCNLYINNIIIHPWATHCCT